MLYTFVPEIDVVGKFQPTATVAELAEEVGMYSASPEFVRTHGGPLTLQMLDAVPQAFYDECDELELFPNIDVRVHRLYPGDFPAVPGWHSDGEYRADYHAQPDLTKFREHKHLVGTISTDPAGVSMTEVVTSKFQAEVVDPTADNTLWYQVHAALEKDKNVDKVSLPDGQLTSMGAFTLHRATPARIRGWRLFLRLSMWHKPYLSDEGGTLARQEYVYRVSESKGW